MGEIIYPKYDNQSFCIFLVMGFCFMFCAWKIKESTLCYFSAQEKQKLYIFAIIVLWTIWASLRYINIYGVGGMDAITYAIYFQDCFKNTGSLYHEHLDFGFQCIFKAVRLITSDYHVLFVLLYSFITASYVFFVKEFSPQETNYAPFILVMHFYVLTFNTLRSAFGISVILYSFVLLNKQYTKSALLLAFSTVLIHKACVIYAMALPFYLFFSKKQITLKHIIILIAFTSIVGVALRDVFISYALSTDLNGAYASYASRSIGNSFFDGAWKQAIEQILLLVCVAFSYKKINQHISELPEAQRKAMQLVFLVCIFDFLLIPVNYYIGNWRASQFLGLVRVVMWGQIVYIWLRQTSSEFRYKTSIIVCAVFMLRIYLSFQNSAVDAGLMPYYFEPVMNTF